MPFLEFLAPAELGLFLAASPLLRLSPRGDGGPVLVMPGFTASDASTLPLRMLLRELGHRPAPWGLGRNLGPTPETLTGISDRLHEVADQSGRAVSIIGWSLGGVYGRALAQWHPELVNQVISLGSPFNIEPDESTTVSPFYNWLSRHRRFIKRDEVDLDTVPCPSSSVYSRTDGVVAWQSCLQTVGPTAENIEVMGSHCGLGVNVAATYAITDRLAGSDKPWEPFRPPSHLRALYPNTEADLCVS